MHAPPGGLSAARSTPSRYEIAALRRCDAYRGLQTRNPRSILLFETLGSIDF